MAGKQKALIIRPPTRRFAVVRGVLKEGGHRARLKIDGERFDQNLRGREEPAVGGNNGHGRGQMKKKEYWGKKRKCYNIG